MKDLTSIPYEMFIKAIEEADYEKIDRLLKKGANPNVRSVDGNENTLLMLAALNNDKKIIDMLIAGKANLDLQDHIGVTAVHHATVMRNTGVVRQLINAGANVSIADKNGEPPLAFAIVFRYHDEVNLLIDAGADVSFTFHDGRDLHKYTKDQGFEETAKRIEDSILKGIMKKSNKKESKHSSSLGL